MFRPVYIGNAVDHFYSSLSDEKKIYLKRDILTYPKVNYSPVLRLSALASGHTRCLDLFALIKPSWLKRRLNQYPSSFRFGSESVDKKFKKSRERERGEAGGGGGGGGGAGLN